MCFHVIPKILIFPVPWTRYIPMFLHHRLGSASFLFWTHPTDGNVIRTLHSDPSHLNLHSHSAVVVDGRDHGLDEFQEDKEVLVHARLQSKHNSMFGGSVISTLINYWYERRKSAVLLGQHTNTHANSDFDRHLFAFSGEVSYDFFHHGRMPVEQWHAKLHKSSNLKSCNETCVESNVSKWSHSTLPRNIQKQMLQNLTDLQGCIDAWGGPTSNMLHKSANL